jgi:type I restriction-modification system DNA methylase subunit
LTLAAEAVECLCRVKNLLSTIKTITKRITEKTFLNPADHISIYGQESNQTTWRLAKMNLAIRGIDSSNVKWNNEGSFLNDAHKDLKADYIIANPPFNDSDWSGELLQKDARWVWCTALPAMPTLPGYNISFIIFCQRTSRFCFIKRFSHQNSNEGEITKSIGRK